MDQLSLDSELQLLQNFYQIVMEFFANYSFQLVGAILIFLIGLFVAGKVSKGLNNFCLRKELDPTLSNFIASIVKIIILAGVAVICLNKLGVEITPFVAAIGAISLGLGLAVQGLLSNYSAGLSIIVTRLFVVGDTISVQGVTGVVKEVRLAYTILSDEDEVTILIPNRHIVGEIIQNSKAEKLVEATIGVAYDSDMDKVKQLLQGVLEKHGLVDNREPQIGIDEFGDSSVNFGLRYWVPTEQYHQLRMQVNDEIFAELQRAGVQIPFPQREVKLLGEG